MNARIESLGARDWRDTAEVDRLTALLKTSVGTQTLRPIQAAALQEAIDCQGLFLHGRVGCGKTLISALLATVLGAKRPVLVVPGGDMLKTARRVIKELRLHWNISPALRIVSYNFLGQANNDGWLQRSKCDLLIADEGHKLCDIGQKNSSGSSVALQVYQFLRENTHVRFCVMSGTLSPHGDLNDYAHLLIMSLRQRAPIPSRPREIKAWCRALEGSGDTRVIMGAPSPAEALRRFQRLLKQTPGCVISDDTFNDVPLHLSVTQHDAPEGTRQAFQDLRDLWMAPDGWTFDDAGEGGAGSFGVAALARQLGNGFYYRHDPRPPEWFLQRRRAWTSYARDHIERENYTSGGQIKIALREGNLRDEGMGLLESWEEAEASFPMKHVADWFALDSILYAAEWAKRTTNGIIWVAHIEVGEALEQLTGLTFYRGQDGLDIEQDDHGGKCVIASIKANGTGKNLQYQFWHNLILAPPANGVDNEQMLGRTHREGAVHPVYAEYVCSCLEHYNAVRKAILAAEKIQDTLSPQKLAGYIPPRKHRQNHPAWMQAHRIKEAS